MNIKDTFLKLVDKTHPHGTEHQLLESLPELSKDSFGNYYRIIGTNPTIMFNSHLDNYAKEQTSTNVYTKYIENEEYVFSDNGILGADDKAGVSLMLYMISKEIDGLYYFFTGEEVGTIGSSSLASKFEDIPYLKNITKCISFDRRGESSIVTHQSGKRCCSDVFAHSLMEELSDNDMEYQLDTTGVYSDSASFIGNIREVTNISVGYYDEHTSKESQNLTFLEKLSKALVSIEWDNLIVHRKVKTPNGHLLTFESFRYKLVN
jgi:di/tripeptidase